MNCNEAFYDILSDSSKLHIFKENLPSLTPPEKALLGIDSPVEHPETACHLKSNAHILLLLLNKQEMKDQMSNSSMQALAERKNRQVRTRNRQVKWMQWLFGTLRSEEDLSALVAVVLRYVLGETSILTYSTAPHHKVERIALIKTV